MSISKKIIPTILLFVMLLFFSPALSKPYSKLGAGNYAREDIVKLIGYENKIDGGYADFLVCNPSKTKYEIKSSDDMAFSFNTHYGDLKGYDVYEQVSEEYNESVPVYKNVEKKVPDYIDNKTGEIHNKTINVRELSGWKEVTKNRTVYRKIKDLTDLSFESNKCRIIRIEVKKEPKVGENNIDAIISFAGLDFNEYVWFNSSFPYCRNISIRNLAGSELTNYVAYVNLTKDSGMQADYDDLRFVNTGCNMGGSQLYHDVDNYTTASAEVWINIPTLPSGTVNISVYYGDATAVSAEDKANTWNDSYEAVWHMEDTTPEDVTSNTNDCSAGGNPSAKEGKIGGAVYFDGNDYLNCGNDDSLDLQGDYTLEAWVYLDSGKASVVQAIFEKGYKGGYMAYTLWHSARKYFHYASETASDWNTQAVTYPQGTIDDNEWHYITGMKNSTGATITLNSTVGQMDSSPCTPFDDNGNFLVGTRNASDKYLTGMVDEIRISSKYRTVAELNQTYQMIDNQANYVQIGDEVSQPVTDTCTYGGSGDWHVLCNDNCTITSDVMMSGNTLYITGTSGSFTINANIIVDRLVIPKGCRIINKANDGKCLKVKV